MGARCRDVLRGGGMAGGGAAPAAFAQTPPPVTSIAICTQILANFLAILTGPVHAAARTVSMPRVTRAFASQTCQGGDKTLGD